MNEQNVERNACIVEPQELAPAAGANCSVDDLTRRTTVCSKTSITCPQNLSLFFFACILCTKIIEPKSRLPKGDFFFFFLFFPFYFLLFFNKAGGDFGDSLIPFRYHESIPNILKNITRKLGDSGLGFFF